MRVLFLLLLTSSAQLVAQDGGQLPMTYVRVDAAVGRRLASDWERMQSRHTEWVYCVIAYSHGLTQDGDTVFVITDIQSAGATVGAHEATHFTCLDTRGASLPLVHAHPSGDCSASRADAAQAVAYRVPFGLVLCGPRSTAGYTRSQFMLMIKGTWYDRANGMP